MTTQKTILTTRLPVVKHPVIDPIRERFSPRIFTPNDIPSEHLDSIFEAARHTPSGRNNQPWFFYVYEQGTPSYEKFITSITDHNGWSLTAPILILACYIPLEPNGAENIWAQYDLGASVMSLTLQAQSMGYYARQMGLFNEQYVKEQIVTDPTHEPFIIIAIGKLGRDEDYQNADQTYVEKDLEPAVKKDVVWKRM